MNDDAKRTFLIWWVGGIIPFAISIFIHAPLTTQGVPSGILDHQAAGNALEVNMIQRSWQADGLQQRAILAMISDIIFILIYGIGCVLGGRYYRKAVSPILRAAGWVAFVSGAIFLITDLGETSAQLFQMVSFSGNDLLAGFAATMQPIKVVSFLAAFFTLLFALPVEWLLSKRA